VCYPRRTDRPLYHGLATQLASLAVPLRSAEELRALGALHSRYDLVLDALFGFSFRGAPRPPFDELIDVSC
jgi:NAD(P)H-hydrate epimerase